MYRKVPSDLLEGTRSGSFMSYFALFTMATLFFLETKAFFGSDLVTDLALDSNREPRVRVNFNITMMDLKCEYTVVDVVSVLGTDQNVTQHVTKFQIDAEGIRQRFHGRNKKQDDIIMHDREVTETIEELHENGEDAISLDADTFTYAKHENEFLFVDFYASWCSHCRDLAPTWETLAEVMTDAAMYKVDGEIDEHHHDYTDDEYEEAVKLALPVFIGKIDCVLHPDFCSKSNIRAYPTLRLYVHGEQKADYRGHRTVIEMTNWLTGMEEQHRKGGGDIDIKKVADAHEVARERMDVAETREEMNAPPKRPDSVEPKSKEEQEWIDKMNQYRSRHKPEWRDDDHPGCQISGFLMVDRAPGNFHIKTVSASHDIAPHMSNVSHEIHHLSFGDPASINAVKRGETLTPSGFLESTQPMDGNVYITRNQHEAHHHYLKVVTTEFDNPSVSDRYRKRNPNFGRRAYQILQSSQLSYYRNDIVPEAKFTYDLSPIAVSYRTSSRRWYDYLTSLMAIIGGMFTVVGMLESGVNTVAGKRRR